MSTTKQLLQMVTTIRLIYALVFPTWFVQAAPMMLLAEKEHRNPGEGIVAPDVGRVTSTIPPGNVATQDVFDGGTTHISNDVLSDTQVRETCLTSQ